MRLDENREGHKCVAEQNGIFSMPVLRMMQIRIRISDITSSVEECHRIIEYSSPLQRLTKSPLASQY